LKILRFHFPMWSSPTSSALVSDKIGHLNLYTGSANSPKQCRLPRLLHTLHSLNVHLPSQQPSNPNQGIPPTPIRRVQSRQRREMRMRNTGINI